VTFSPKVTVKGVMGGCAGVVGVFWVFLANRSLYGKMSEKVK